MTIDAVLAAADLGTHLRRDFAAVIGHSLGAYTALAAAGGTPYFPAAQRRAHRRAARRARGGTRAAGARRNAVVLDAGLARLGCGPYPDVQRRARSAHARVEHGDVVARGIAEPSRLTHVRMPNAGHFSFLSAILPPSGAPTCRLRWTPRVSTAKHSMPGSQSRSANSWTACCRATSGERHASLDRTGRFG